MQEQKKDISERMELGYDWLKQGNLSRINSLFRNGMNAAPDFVEKAFLYADLIKQTANNYHQAASIFYGLIIEQPENPWPYLYRGIAFLMDDVPFGSQHQGGNAVDAALALFNSAIIIDRKNPIAYYARAKAHFYHGDLTEAFEDAKTACTYRENYKTTIEYSKFVEFLENQLTNPDLHEFQYQVGGFDTLKEEYEKVREYTPDSTWIRIDWGHRFSIRPGDWLREYVSPYRDPQAIFYREYQVSMEPHIRVTKVFQGRKWPIESIGLANGEYSQTRNLFEHETWIKRDGLTSWKTWHCSKMPVFL